MTNYERAVAAYQKHLGSMPMSSIDKNRLLRAMARAGRLTIFGARVLFLTLERALPDLAHFNVPPPWVVHDPHYVSARRLKRMVDAYDGRWGSAHCE